MVRRRDFRLETICQFLIYPTVPQQPNPRKYALLWGALTLGLVLFDVRNRSKQLGTGSSSVLVIPSHTPPPSYHHHPISTRNHPTSTAPQPPAPHQKVCLSPLPHSPTSRRVKATCMPHRSCRPLWANIVFTPSGSPSTLAGLQSHPLQLASRGIPMPGRRGRGFCQQRKTSGAPTH